MNYYAILTSIFLAIGIYFAILTINSLIAYGIHSFTVNVEPPNKLLIRAFITAVAFSIYKYLITI
jgi:uncharacterized BrkB/YihY/UPF0761 family membrane protein